MAKSFEDKNQRGAILIFSILILVVILMITFTVMGILIPKVRIASDPIKSIAALSAADSGLEWCLYLYRDNYLPEPLPKPVFSTGALVDVYYPSSGITEATCDSSIETSLDHRSVGSYLDVARSLEIR
jgi:hypothetical protein